MPRYEGLYEVSDRGQVRTLDREMAHYLARSGTMIKRGKILAPAANKGGHLRVTIYDKDGKRKAHFVHHLVLEAFDRPCPEGMECLHGPGGPADNRWPEAIHWGTKRENMLDRHRDGAFTQAKLTPEIVLICRARRANGEFYKAIAGDYGVCWQTVQEAVTGKTWRHVA